MSNMKQKQKREGGQAETDSRVERSKAAVLAATYELLSEEGLGGVSVDEVSARSGVAKTWKRRKRRSTNTRSQLS
jgi:AcrR family transcriptional regulator